MKYRKNLVFIAAYLGMLLFGMVFLSLGTVSVFIQDKFGIGSQVAASLASSLPLGILAGSVLFGPVTDRYGYKILLVSSTVLIAIAFELIAFARSISLLQGSFILIGMAGGMINGVTNALVADIAAGEKSSRLSLLGVFYGVGALGMPFVIGAVAESLPYESLISATGLILIIPLLYFIFLKFPEPKMKQGFPLSKAAGFFKDPVIIMMGLVLFFESALEGITGNWATSYLTSVGNDINDSLIALSVHVASIAVARLLLSRILGKTDTLIVIYCSFALILAGAVTLALSGSFAGFLIAMVFLGWGFAAVFPVILGMVGERYPSISGTAFSFVIVIALAGNSSVNYLTGIISDQKGIQSFPYIILICAGLMIIIFRILTGIQIKQNKKFKYEHTGKTMA